MKNIRFLALCLALCLILTACGGSAQGQPAQNDPTPPDTTGSDPAKPDDAEDSTLVIAIADEVEGLDIQQIGWANVVHDLLYEPLVVYDTDLDDINPAFAESYTATDEYLEFVLPADARFSNGDVLDAAAVKASFERMREVSDYGGDLEPISEFKVMDERTIRFMLSEPSPAIWSVLGIMFGGLVDVKVAEEIGEWEFNRKPVGNGAYCVEEWVPGSHLTLVRNEYFKTANPELTNKGAAHFKKVIVKFITDGEQRMQALLNGEADIIFNVPSTGVASLKATPGIKTYECQLTGVSYLNLQTEKGPLQDIRVRQALTYAVDRDAINAALGGIVTPTYSLLSESQFGHSAVEERKLAQDLAYDPDYARMLLDEAGWKDTDGDGIRSKGGEPLSLEMLIPSDNGTFQAAGVILRKQFAAIGVDAQIREEEADYIKELMRADEYTIGTRTYEWMDAQILSWAFTNESGYQWEDPELTALLKKAERETDVDERIALYALASDRLAQDFKAISLYSDGIFIAASENVKGFVVCEDGRAWINDMTRG